MAPSLVLEQPPIVNLAKAAAVKATIPSQKKLLASGQLEPIYELLQPYSTFPKEISGPTVWTAEEYLAQPDTWTHRWTGPEIAAIERSAEVFIAAGYSLTDITKELFPLPDGLKKLLAGVREEMLTGKGFVLFKGFPVEKWGNELSAVAYMGIGTYLGYFVSQNSRGHVLGHVKDLGDDAEQIDKVRIYRTNARQFFHTDDCDIVGLLCMHRALEGGESDVVSSHHVFNYLQRHRPDIVELLTKPIWYFDRKGEVSRGQKEWIRTSVFYQETGPNPRVYTKWDPYYVESLTRFSDIGLIPPLSEEQKEAARVLEETCAKLSLHMILEVGDIQFLSDAQTLHARTAYRDHPAPYPRRHLMRLWLATPQGEGGWRLPFEDAGHRKRGGVQVNDNPEVAPLDGE